MNKQLPPLNNLRAFEVAARHMSFRVAASELHITPSAVSQRIRALESQLGTLLFHRSTRAVNLTIAGEILAGDLLEAFDVIAGSLSRIHRLSQTNTFTISTTVTFAEKWLLPRLPHFNQRFPEFDVRVFSGDTLADFSSDSMDLAIRFGRGKYPGLIAEQLSMQKYYPVCSPRLLNDAETPLRSPDDLLKHTLIDTHWQMESAAAPKWSVCLRNAGVDTISNPKTLGFSVETLSIRAAIDGLGIALANELLIEADLAAGVLVKPFDDNVSVASQFQFYIVFPERSADDAKIVHFKKWLFEQAQK